MYLSILYVYLQFIAEYMYHSHGSWNDLCAYQKPLQYLVINKKFESVISTLSRHL
uniref:Uncharacterized protein n=1 Tax=Lepeophtheirus salmonis TaxID=72036 RepID=A0A0K2UAP5_LEPSM